jgi:hypothetical protein
MDIGLIGGLAPLFALDIVISAFATRREVYREHHAGVRPAKGCEP